jgi:putative DNA primase/helicase
MWWACNKLPAASEDTTAYYRRFIILHFNKIFTGKKADINLLEKLTTPEEISGLFNLALYYKDKLLQKGEFSNSASIEETRQQYIRTADSCQAFIEEMTETSDSQDDYVTYDDLFSNYIAFCKKYNLPKQRKANLTNAMALIRPEANLSQKRIKKERPRVWQYLKLKEKPKENSDPVTSVTAVTKTLPLSSFEKSENKEGETSCDSRDGCDSKTELEK